MGHRKTECNPGGKLGPRQLNRLIADISQLDELEVVSREVCVDRQLRGRGIGWVVVDLRNRHAAGGYRRIG